MKRKIYKSYLSGNANGEYLNLKYSRHWKETGILRILGTSFMIVAGTFLIGLSASQKVANANYNTDDTVYASEVYEDWLGSVDEITTSGLVAGSTMTLAGVISLWLSIKKFKKTIKDFDNVVFEAIDEFLKQPTFVAYLQKYEISLESLKDPNFADKVIEHFIETTDRILYKDESKRPYIISDGAKEQEMLQ